jgi:TolA-binding protein
MIMKIAHAFFARCLLLIALLLSFALQPLSAEAAVKIGVLQFEGNDVSVSQAGLIANLLSGEIAASKVLSLDMMPGFSGSVGPVSLEAAVTAGLEAGLEYVALWSLEDLSEIEPAEPPEREEASGDVSADKADKVSFNVSAFASATLDVRLVDVASKEIWAGFSETGGSSPAVSPLAIPRREAMEREFGELKARAVVSAVSLMGRAMRGLAGEKDSFVISAKDEVYGVNIGETSGAKAGNLYAVFSDWQWEKIPIAILRLDEAGRESSVCSLARQSGAAVKRGDRIEKIDQSQAEEITLMAYREPPEKKPEPDAPPEVTVASADAVVSEDRIQVLAERALASGAQITTPETSSDKPPSPPSFLSAPVVTRAPGVDRDKSTGLDLIETFQLSPIDRSNLHIKQRNARNLYERGRYGEAFSIFKQLAETYKGNYLSAYWAGMAAFKLDHKNAAIAWFDRVLEINPNYQPALEAKELAK